MKPRLLELLVCPACRGSFRLAAEARDGGEVVRGALACGGCRAT